MSENQDEAADKSFEATPQKLQKAREKGDVALSKDLLVAAAYGGILITAFAFGADSIDAFSSSLMALLDRPHLLAPLFFQGPSAAPVGGLMSDVSLSLLPWTIVPIAAVLLAIFAQRGFVFAPTKLQPKLSRISIIQNAKQKFGRSGLFEWAKSFAKLVIYSICLGLFINAHLNEMISAIAIGPRAAIVVMVQQCLEFTLIATLIALVIGGVDAVFQHAEHLRKNRMTRKEIQDETKDTEGDPYLKQERRARAQHVASSQMMADVPDADVVVVNPTHYAVALKWSRAPGSAPVCVAKGVDEIAAAIREAASLAGVPIHHDPPTARALHATVKIGDEIELEHYAPVAAAIRFAEDMRRRAKASMI
jgi:flagellar biosynthetic protein FlhB